MKNRITSTDVKYIAKGCWENYFQSRFHPKTKTALLIAIMTITIGIALAIGTAIDSANASVESSGLSAVDYLGMGLLIIGLGFFCKAMLDYYAEKQSFIDSTVAKWENGDESLPDNNELIKFITGGK